MKAKTILKEIISEILKPLFKKNNFKTSGTTFLKEESGFIKVFNIQSSKFNSVDSIKFTFNIGFFFPNSYRLLSPLPYPKSISVADCQINFRSGHLTKDGNDHWYKINDQTSIDNLKIEINTDLKTIIEFFQKYSSSTELIKLNNTKYWGTARVELDTSLALLEQDRIEDANELFNKYYLNYKGNENWLRKLEELAAEKGLKLDIRK